MAELAKRRLRRKVDQLALALDGRLAEHQRFLLRSPSARHGLCQIEADGRRLHPMRSMSRGIPHSFGINAPNVGNVHLIKAPAAGNP